MITLDRVRKQYPGAARPAVDDLSMHVPEGTTVALVGPSGCGKTTALRMINRLIEPTGGTILLDGRPVGDLDPVMLRRRIGYVIQQVGLFPHMTIAQNIAAVPKLLGWERRRIEQRTAELLQLVGLQNLDMLARFPAQLSGGQRQRIGVARALAADPAVLLMDEPFGALDPLARTALQVEFKQILRRVRKTVVLVTHDLDEAVHLGDRIAVMRDGKVVQYDTPDTVLSRPTDDFVASFVGVDRALVRLRLFTAADAMVPEISSRQTVLVSSSMNLREVLSVMIASRAEVIGVLDESGVPRGHLTREAIWSV